MKMRKKGLLPDTSGQTCWDRKRRTPNTGKERAGKSRQTIMRKTSIIKTLTVAMAIAAASGTVGTTAMAEDSETAIISEATTETSAPATEAPPQTEAPQTEAPQTEPPQTEPPQTEAPQTEAPQTEAPPQTEALQTEIVTEAQTSAPETQVHTEAVTERQTEGSTEAQTQASTETTKATESEKTTETKATEDHSDMLTGPSGEERHDTRFDTNEKLIAHQDIKIPEIKEDFRFEKVDAEKAFIKQICTIKEEMNETSKTVGIAHAGDTCYILEETSDDWYYIESGKVRGYIPAENLVRGHKNEKNSVALQAVDNTDNSAVTHTKTSAYSVVVSGTPAMLRSGASIFEEKSSSSRVVGVAEEENCSCSILADEGEEWNFIESGDVRGFVKSSDLTITGSTDEEHVAEETVEPEENKACFYSLASTQEKNAPSYTRRTMIDFAMKFIGNPYVWGGTSLTNGADCSGYVQSIYSHFGYSIPRVACDQAEYGKQIPVEYAQPGDLVFYASEGYVYHVAMYIGDGMTVQARGTAYGITTCPVGNAVWATNILD